MNLVSPLLSWIYARLVQVRNKLYDCGLFSSYISSLPVISVGNISVGGNAKTPLCIRIATELRARGFSPVILSRGYGGKAKGPMIVNADSSVLEVGDEPLLLQRKTGCPVVVSRRRSKGARLIEEKALGDVILLDDGFQHRALGRTVDIVSINCGDEAAIQEFLRNRLLPWGRFRESRDHALQRAHIVVLVRRELGGGLDVPPDARILALLPRSVQVFSAFFQSNGVIDIKSGAPLAPTTIAAFCGIANPSGFFNSLRALKFQIVQEFRFSDHHVFTSSEFTRMRSQVDSNVPFVCTEKDAMRLPKETPQVYMLPIEVELYPQDTFMSSLQRSILKFQSKLHSSVDNLTRAKPTKSSAKSPRQH